jgi:hypothetical protein
VVYYYNKKKRKTMGKRMYGIAQTKKDFQDWKEGRIKKSMMTTKEWRAFKRRINRAGLRKEPSCFKLSRKDCTAEEYRDKKRRYALEYRRRNRATT